MDVFQGAKFLSNLFIRKYFEKTLADPGTIFILHSHSQVLGVLNINIALLGPLETGENFSNMKKVGSGEISSAKDSSPVLLI